MDMLLLEIMEMRNYVSVLQGILSFKKLHHLIDVGLTIEMQQFFIAILLVAQKGQLENWLARAEADSSQPGLESTNADFDFSLTGDVQMDCGLDLLDQVVWLQVELFKWVEEQESFIPETEELETAWIEMNKQNNGGELREKVEQVEPELVNLQGTLLVKQLQGKKRQPLNYASHEQLVTSTADFKSPWHW